MKPPEMELELDPIAWKAINSGLLLKATAKVAGHGTELTWLAFWGRSGCGKKTELKRSQEDALSSICHKAKRW